MSALPQPSPPARSKALKKTLEHGIVSFGAVGMALACFLVLPLIQQIQRGKEDLWDVRKAAASAPEEPPDQAEPEPEPEEEPEEDEPPQELDAPPEMPNLDLLASMMDGGSGGSGPGLFHLDLTEALRGRAQEDDSLFGETTQPAQILSQTEPVLDAKQRKKTPGFVTVIFLVDTQGKVANAKAEESSDPILERPVLTAVKRWKFDPAKKGGKPIPSRKRITVQLKG